MTRDAIEEIGKRLKLVGSERRLAEMLRLIGNQPPGVFWPVLIEWWNVCDDTWWLKGELLDLMRFQRAWGALPYIAARKWPVQIYRGCSRTRVRGVSWTTDRTVAESFARGHRCIPVPDPVIASATVDRPAVFAAIDDRNEAELLVDPRRLRKLIVEEARPPVLANTRSWQLKRADG